MTLNRVALALARRYGNTPAWAVARRIVDRADSYLRAVSLFLYDHDGQRIAREAVREREKEEAGRQALAELDALIARLKKEAAEAVGEAGPTEAETGPTEVETAPAGAGTGSDDGAPNPDVARLMAVGRALGRKVIEDMSLRMATGKAGRN